MAVSQSDKAKELRTTLDNLIENFKEKPEDIAELLAFKNRFYNYSANNNMLIYSQHPYATYVASYEDWKKKGYQVQKGQHGIKIIFPIHTEIFEVGEKDGKKIYRRVADASPEDRIKINSRLIKPFNTTRFGVGNVFDISQTDCPAEDYPKLYHMGYSSDQHAAVYEAFKDYCLKRDIPVVETDLHSIALRGQFSPLSGVIQISDKLNDTEKLSTLTHEFGHALLHGDRGSAGKNPSVKELEADCVSIMLQQEFGIDLTESRKKHFVDHYNVCKGLKNFSLEDVLKNVSASYLNLRKELDPIIESAIVHTPEQSKRATVGITEQQNKSLAAESIQKPIETKQSSATAEPPRRSGRKEYRDYREQDAAVLDYIKRGVSILRVAEDMGFTPQQIGGYYTLKEHDSVRFYTDTNSFHRFSADVGGSPIDFVMHFGGLNEKEAIQSLKDKYIGYRLDSIPQYTPPAPASTPEPKKFELPEQADGKFTRTFAYLTKTRCLDAGIVQQCMKDGLIYEDNKHNVVFVASDETGKPAYATRHTTLTNSDFKRDVAGSRQDIGWIINNKSDRLYVTEAPIDAMSIMCLRKHQGKAIADADYMATCGTGKDAALYFRLKQHPYKEVILANDNDEAGQKANRKIYDQLRTDYPDIKISFIKPKGKDINEHLCKFCAEKCLPKDPKKMKTQEVEK